MSTKSRAIVLFMFVIAAACAPDADEEPGTAQVESLTLTGTSVDIEAYTPVGARHRWFRDGFDWNFVNRNGSAIGLMRFLSSSGTCTGTLVGESTVLTARHCMCLSPTEVIQGWMTFGEQLQLGTGNVRPGTTVSFSAVRSNFNCSSWTVGTDLAVFTVDGTPGREFGFLPLARGSTPRPPGELLSPPAQPAVGMPVVAIHHSAGGPKKVVAGNVTFVYSAGPSIGAIETSMLITGTTGLREGASGAPLIDASGSIRGVISGAGSMGNTNFASVAWVVSQQSTYFESRGVRAPSPPLSRAWIRAVAPTGTAVEAMPQVVRSTGSGTEIASSIRLNAVEAYEPWGTGQVVVTAAGSARFTSGRVALVVRLLLTKSTPLTLSLDASFGNGGILLLDLPGSVDEEITAMTPRVSGVPTGNRILAGWVSPSEAPDSRRILLARMFDSGALDPAFGATNPGYSSTVPGVIHDVAGSDLEAPSVVRSTWAGSLLVGGYSTASTGSPAFYLAAFRADGSRDTGFRPGGPTPGELQLNLGTAAEEVRDVSVSYYGSWVAPYDPRNELFSLIGSGYQADGRRVLVVRSVRGDGSVVLSAPTIIGPPSGYTHVWANSGAGGAVSSFDPLTGYYRSVGTLTSFKPSDGNPVLDVSFGSGGRMFFSPRDATSSLEIADGSVGLFAAFLAGTEQRRSLSPNYYGTPVADDTYTGMINRVASPPSMIGPESGGWYWAFGGGVDSTTATSSSSTPEGHFRVSAGHIENFAF